MTSSRPALSPAIIAAALATWPLAVLAAPATPPEITNHVAIDGYTVAYPDGWSTLRSGQVTLILNVPAEEQAALGERFVFTPQVSISTEQRLDKGDALKELEEIAAGVDPSVRRLTVGGFPAVQWRRIVPWPRSGDQKAAAGSALTINTAVAAGSQLIRLYGSLRAEAPAALAETLAAIERSLGVSSGLGSASPAVIEIAPAGPGGPEPALPMAEEELEERAWGPPPSVDTESALEAAAPGAAQRILQGTAASEPEVATSANGRNVVVAQQFVWTASNDGGQTFPFFGRFPNSTGGDSSLAVGQSGNFYEGTIFKNTTAIHRSTDGGQTFPFRGTAFTCGALPQCNFTGGQIPDQEHIAADRVNQVGNQDQVYSAFRNGSANPTWGITCSTDGGGTWSAGNVGITGDFPRIAVGGDGSVYVAFEDDSGGQNRLRLAKFASCKTNSALPTLAGWPVTVAAGVAELPCPVPGLDRCNNGNTLRGPTVAVDDSNSAHIFYAYATNSGGGNENILIRDSSDGGANFSAPTQLSGGGTARRFMPWMCVTRGTAFVSWYDRRRATGANNDLTDYFGGSASRSGASLNAGAEFQLNDSATSDAQCVAGQPVGSQASWPGGSRANSDSTSCSQQPELAGVCGTGPCGPGNTCPAGQTCDVNAAPAISTGICRNGAQQFCDFATTVCANAADSCRLWGGGVPKYGDYNGNACAQGHLYAVWASATPARAANPGIDLFFKVRDTVDPIAACQNVTTHTDPGVCVASGVSIDNGSTDPDNDTFTLNQTPANPYPEGTTAVTLTLTDQNGQTHSCVGNVTVKDLEPPTISCPASITAEFMSSAGAVVTFPLPAAADNCAVMTVTTAPASGSTFPIGTTTVTGTAVDTSGNTATCTFTVTVVGARGVKQDVLNELIALRATLTDREDIAEVAEAIEELQESLAAAFWIDETHVQPKKGERVFREEMEAVHELVERIRDKDSGIPGAVWQGFVDRIVKSDRLLAEVAISDAVAMGGRAKEIAKAKRELMRGDKRVAARRFESAIESYLEAWEEAQEAVGKRQEERRARSDEARR
jgi:hypothetical protein